MSQYHNLCPQDENIIDADEDDQLAAAIQASLAESQKPTSSDSCGTAINSRVTETYTDTPSDSDLETYSGDDSNLSTPVKKVPSNTETAKNSEPQPECQKDLLTKGNYNQQHSAMDGLYRQGFGILPLKTSLLRNSKL